MKLNEIKLTVKDLAAKHNLVVKSNGKAIEDFAFSAEIESDFKNNGFELRFNNKKNQFDVISDDEQLKKQKNQDTVDARLKQGFSASGKRRTTANVGGGHSVNGIKK